MVFRLLPPVAPDIDVMIPGRSQKLLFSES
jgi:hypothetical protein